MSVHLYVHLTPHGQAEGSPGREDEAPT
uniref:Uncharacterized protein n=1 Tax=Anguilla anguilla TaxID=7936 RepID=A0A0E9SM30_ANGAN